MADSTINGLTALAAASVVPGTDVAPVWQGSASTTKKVTIADLVVAGNTFGTIAASSPATISQTWNNAAVTFTGKLISITDTASNANSLLQDWQVGGSSKLSIVKTGKLLGNGANPFLFLDNSVGSQFGYGTGILTNGGSSLTWAAAGTEVARVDNAGLVSVASGGGYQWSSTAASSGTKDLILLRDAAGVLAQKNSTNAQEFRVYKSTTGTQYKALLGDGNLIKIAGYAFTNGAGASTGTLTNAPAVGNPTKWIPIDDNGTTRYIPAW